MTTTQENLSSAFAGESQANRKYLAFAKIADKEGKPNLAMLFRAIAEGETVHALKHLGVMGGIKNSIDNLQASIAGETYEIETMYPGFIADAKRDSNKGAEISFIGAMEVEKIHQKHFSDALLTVEKNEDIEAKNYFVCGICGFLADGEAPDECPICKSRKEKFISIA